MNGSAGPAAFDWTEALTFCATGAAAGAAATVGAGADAAAGVAAGATAAAGAATATGVASALPAAGMRAVTFLRARGACAAGLSDSAGTRTFSPSARRSDLVRFSASWRAFGFTGLCGTRPCTALAAMRSPDTTSRLLASWLLSSRANASLAARIEDG
ncbi:hypothetical protein EKL02_10515 [Janthinobacterium sp. 17J80-10]|nr:hypothetical protein EKL02_10515 [Janthinobacterium sp. 17J80-10]